MPTSIFQHRLSRMGVHIVMGLILATASYALLRQVPNGDLSTLFNPAMAEDAISSGQIHLLGLTLTAFGVGLGGNYFISRLGKLLRIPVLGKGVIALIAVIVIGGLVIGVTANWLSGVTIPLFMNAGIGLLVGSGLGWWVANGL